jgi:hypothetical protein
MVDPDEPWAPFEAIEARIVVMNAEAGRVLGRTCPP